MFWSITFCSNIMKDRIICSNACKNVYNIYILYNEYLDINLDQRQTGRKRLDELVRKRPEKFIIESHWNGRRSVPVRQHDQEQLEHFLRQFEERSEQHHQIGTSFSGIDSYIPGKKFRRMSTWSARFLILLTVSSSIFIFIKKIKHKISPKNC